MSQSTDNIEKYDTLIAVRYTEKKRESLKREAKKRGVKFSDHLRDKLDQPLFQHKQ